MKPILGWPTSRGGWWECLLFQQHSSSGFVYSSNKADLVLDSTIWNLTVNAKEENKHLCNSCIHF